MKPFNCQIAIWHITVLCCVLVLIKVQVKGLHPQTQVGEWTPRCHRSLYKVHDAKHFQMLCVWARMCVCVCCLVGAGTQMVNPGNKEDELGLPHGLFAECVTQIVFLQLRQKSIVPLPNSLNSTLGLVWISPTTSLSRSSVSLPPVSLPHQSLSHQSLSLISLSPTSLSPTSLSPDRKSVV